MANVTITPQTNEIHKIKPKGSNTQYYVSDEVARTALGNVQISLDNIFENGNQCIDLDCSATTSSSSYLQNITIAQGANNTLTRKTITHTTAGDTIKTTYQPVNSQIINV